MFYSETNQKQWLKKEILDVSKFLLEWCTLSTDLLTMFEAGWNGNLELFYSAYHIIGWENCQSTATVLPSEAEAYHITNFS